MSVHVYARWSKCTQVVGSLTFRVQLEISYTKAVLVEVTDPARPFGRAGRPGPGALGGAGRGAHILLWGASVGREAHCRRSAAPPCAPAHTRFQVMMIMAALAAA